MNVHVPVTPVGVDVGGDGGATADGVVAPGRTGGVSRLGLVATVVLSGTLVVVVLAETLEVGGKEGADGSGAMINGAVFGEPLHATTMPLTANSNGARYRATDRTLPKVGVPWRCSRRTQFPRDQKPSSARMAW
jgi:hypothetical protein